MKTYNSFKRNTSSFIDMNHIECAIYDFDRDQIDDDHDWNNDRSEKQIFISVDHILLNQPDLLLRHERRLLDDVYEDDSVYQKNIKNQFFLFHTYL
jgi:hypothetical protein